MIHDLLSKHKVFIKAVEQSGDGVVITDTDGKIIYINKTFASKMEYETHELLYKHSRILKSGIQDELFYKNLWETITKGKTWSGRINNKTKRSTIIPFSVKITPIIDENGSISHFVSTHRDITYEVEIEKKLKEDKKRSENENHFKTEFISTMSHELRTPLNVVCGIADILINTPLSDKQLELIQILKTSSDHLVNILNDVLDLSKIESSRIILDNIDFDFHNLIDEITKTYQFQAEKKNLNFEVNNYLPTPFICKGDPTRIRQILGNLLNNSIKFTSQGYIKFTVEENRIKEKPGNILFKIQDTGIGIGEDSKHKLFVPFSQEDKSVSRKFGGTGLGLSICKELVQLMNGSIWFESIKYKGSTFHITIDTEITNNRPLPIEQKVPQSINCDSQSKMLKFLIIDDSLENQLILQNFLEDNSNETICAGNGLEGFELYKTFHPDFVIMDIEMPIMNGFECTESIRKYEKKHQMISSKIIILSGYGYTDYAKKSLNIGCNDYLIKPISKKAIIEKINQLKSFK